LEAFFFGVPLITSNVTSMPEIASGESALLVDPRSEGELVAAMTSICDDSLLCNRLVENGRRRLQDFDWDSTMAKIVNIYDEVLERR
jgi:glycosyltransferase involved in cell wall biosynthesis